METDDRAIRRSLALAYLEESRKDFRQRVDLKQQIVVFYAGATAAIVGFVFKNGFIAPVASDLLFSIPMISMAAAALFADHMLATTGLSKYNDEILRKHLDPEPESPASVKLWDQAPQLLPLISIFWLLQLGEAVLFCLTPILCLTLACWVSVVEWFRVPAFVDGLRVSFLLIGLVCLAFTFILLSKIRKETGIFGPPHLYEKL